MAVQLAAQGWKLEQVAPGTDAVLLVPAGAKELHAKFIGSVLNAAPPALREGLVPAWQECSGDAAVGKHVAGAHMAAAVKTAEHTTPAHAIALALLTSQ